MFSDTKSPKDFIFCKKNLKFSVSDSPMDKKWPKTLIIDQKQHFWRSMWCFGPQGVCCVMFFDTKSPQKLKFRIKKSKNSVFDAPADKKWQKTSVINQKQHFQSSMGCFNSIGICCSMVLDTKLSKDFKFSIQNRKLSVSDPHIGQNMTKNASKWPATYPWEWGQGFANLTKSDLYTSSPRVKASDSALESW